MPKGPQKEKSDAKDAARAAGAKEPAADAAQPGDVSEEERFSHALGVFASVKQAQLQNGLRHEDYVRYRDYCARRVRRIRVSLHFTCGKGKAYAKKEVSGETAADPRHLLLVLVSAERAWSHYMAIKQQNAKTPNAKAKSHMIARLSKAAKHAGALEAVCAAAAEPRTLVEAKAYAAWMKGNLAMEKQLWSEASERYEVAKRVCEELSKVGFPEQQAIFHERLEELAPKLRFCAYHQKKGAVVASTADATEHPELKQLIEGVVNEAAKAGQELKDITWRGRSIPVRSDKLRDRLEAAQEAAASAKQAPVFQERMKFFDSVFTLLSDAQQILRDLKATQLRHGVKQDAVKDTDALTDYVTYLRHSNSVERSTWLARIQQRRLSEGALPDVPGAENPAIDGADAKRVVRAEDIARLYDSALSSATEAASSAGDTSSFTIAPLRALRCYYVALTYLADAKFTEAYVLFNRSIAHTERCASSSSSAEMSSLVQFAEKFKVVAQARAAAAALREPTVPLAAGLPKGSIPSVEAEPDTYDQNWEGKERKLVDFPPTMEIVPPRPMLFDLAGSELDYPNVEERTKEAEKTPAKGGFFSFWR